MKELALFLIGSRKERLKLIISLSFLSQKRRKPMICWKAGKQRENSYSSLELFYSNVIKKDGGARLNRRTEDDLEILLDYSIPGKNR